MKYNSTIMDMLLLSRHYARFIDFEPLAKFKDTSSYKEFVEKLNDSTKERFKSFFHELTLYNEDVYFDNLTAMLYLGIKIGMEMENIFTDFEE